MPVTEPLAPIQSPVRPTAVLDGWLEPKTVALIAHGHTVPVLCAEARARVAAAHARLEQCIAERRLVYGVTTGFGPLADRIVSPSDGRTLQENLINHLASGVGAPLDWARARAVALARLNSLLQGVSGASPAAVDLLVALLASPLAPDIPEKGTVGASGDLTPLAHLALALMGRGGFRDATGRQVSTHAAFALLGRAPLTLDARDGLALVNGTSAMTGIAAVNAEAARRLLAWSSALTAAAGELLGVRTEAWHPAFAAVRPHPGQAEARRAIAGHVDGSGLTVEDRAAARRLEPDLATSRQRRAPQDAYCLRCAPQVIGACLDTADWHGQIVTTELNSATDNPIFPDPASGADSPALHGGNFMGQHVAFAADALSNALCVAAGLAERQLARLTDETLNGGLPAFLHRGPAGLNSGLMGAQVTATALHAEMRSRAIPASIQSISTNAANQDVVSMGTIAARRTAEHLADAWRIQAILALAVAQGLDILDGSGRGAASPAFRALRDRVRTVAPPLESDRPLSAEIEALASAMADTDPLAAAGIAEDGE